MITGHALVPPTTSLSTVTSILSPPPSSSFPASTNIPSGYTSLDILVRVLWKSTGDGDTGVRSEGGRAVSNLVRSAYHGKGKKKK